MGASMKNDEDIIYPQDVGKPRVPFVLGRVEKALTSSRIFFNENRISCNLSCGFRVNVKVERAFLN
jgi:hypothetical protein